MLGENINGILHWNDGKLNYHDYKIGLSDGMDSVYWNGKIYVNNKILEEHYGIIYDDSNLNETIVQNGYFFVLGDNRPISQDSRSWGMVSKEQIIGKAWFRYWPISNIGLVKH